MKAYSESVVPRASGPVVPFWFEVSCMIVGGVAIVAAVSGGTIIIAETINSLINEYVNQE